jgi:hypothetical protein
MYFWLKPLAFLTVRWKMNDLGRTRTCNPQIRSLVPYPLGHKATLILVFRFISRPSTFPWKKYWIRYSNRYSKFMIIPHGLSIEECYSALAPYQGSVFLHWTRYEGKIFLLFWLSVRRNSFWVGSQGESLSALTQCMGKVTIIRWPMTHSHILIICSFCDVFLTEVFGIPHR